MSLRHFCAYFGIPLEVWDRVYAVKKTLVKENGEFWGRPFKPGEYYGHTYCDPLFRELTSRIRSDHYNELRDVTFIAIALAQVEAQNEVLKNALFPHMFFSRVCWQPSRDALGKVSSQSVNELIEALAKATDLAKLGVMSLTRELTERSNKTPLLLPTKNFHSDVLTNELYALQRSLAGNAGQPENEIQSCKDRILHAHPGQRKTEGHKKKPKTFYVDARNVSFCAPGKARHGQARPTYDHPERCILSGRRRLGAPYDFSFHYDCTRDHQPGNLKGIFFGCHTPEQSMEGDPHLNIAPNDFVRR